MLLILLILLGLNKFSRSDLSYGDSVAWLRKRIDQILCDVTNNLRCGRKDNDILYISHLGSFNSKFGFSSIWTKWLICRKHGVK